MKRITDQEVKEGARLGISVLKVHPQNAARDACYEAGIAGKVWTLADLMAAA